MSDPCEKCPCPDVCLGRPEWCGWMRGEPTDIEVRSICERSRIAAAATAYPPLLEQAGNVLAAAGRVLGAVARGEAVMAPADVVAARRAICLPCEHNGHRESGGIRCMKCGCTGLKLDLATEACPVGKWDIVKASN